MLIGGGCWRRSEAAAWRSIRSSRWSLMAGSRSPRAGSRSPTIAPRCMDHMRGRGNRHPRRSRRGRGERPRGQRRPRPGLHQGKCGNVMSIDHQRHRAAADRGLALHPPLHRQDDRRQGRRPADDRSGAGAQPGEGRAAAPLGRDPPGAGPRRRPADRRADGARGQDGRADRRPARDRRRDARHRPHGAGRQDQPRAGRGDQRARAGRGRGRGRGRAVARGDPDRPAAGLRRQGRQGPRAACSTPCSTTGWCRSSRPSAPTPMASPTTSTPTMPRGRSRWRWGRKRSSI